MRMIVAPSRSQTQHLESTWATSRSPTNTWRINEGTPTEMSPTWRIFPKSPLEGNSPAILYPLCRDLEENVNAIFFFLQTLLRKVKTLINKHLREWDAWALNPTSEPGCLVICFIIGNGTAVFSFLLSRNRNFNREHKGNFPCHARSVDAKESFQQSWLLWAWPDHGQSARYTILFSARNPGPRALCWWHLTHVTSNRLLSTGAHRITWPKYTFLKSPIKENNLEEDAKEL